MKYRQIEAFRNVMISGSLTQAADAMALSQPAVSHLISDLEDWLGFALFQRRPGQPLQATEDAEALYAEVSRSFVGLQELMKAGREIKTLRKGHLRVVGPPFVANSLLCEATASFAQEYSDSLITLEARSHQEIISMMVGRIQDIGVAVLPVAHPALEVTSIGKFQVLCAIPAGHPLAGAARINVTDLESQPLITNANGSQLDVVTENLLQSAGVSVKRRITVRNQEIACSLVARGLGIAIIANPLPSHITQYAGIVLREFQPSVFIELGILLSKMRPPSRMVVEFIKQITRQLETRQSTETPP